MRIDQLRLKAYGHFQDTTLDLSSDNPGLHVVFGPNEAGKSTTLRAITALLYGFPHVTTDGFQHQNRDLRVGGRIVDSAGNVIECMRRKSRKESLYDGDDDSPVEESTLQKMLRGIDRDAFLDRFGMTHESLVAGGEMMVQGDGDLGQSLFAAGAGLGQLKQFQDSIDEQCAALFKRGGTKSTINELLTRLRDKKNELKACQLQVGEFVQLEKEREFTAEQAETNRKASHEIRGKLRRAEAILAAIPIVNEITELERQLVELSDAPVLSASFAERHQNAVVASESTEKRITQLRESIASDEEKANAISCDEDVLQNAEKIEALVLELGSNKKAQQQKPGLEKRRELLQSQIRSRMKSLGLAEETDPWSIDLPHQARVKISNLAAEYPSLTERVESALEDLASLRSRQAEVALQLESSVAPKDASKLMQALRNAGDPSELLRDCQAAQQNCDRHLRELEQQRRQLPGFTGTVQQCIELTPPSVASVEQFSSHFEDINKQKEQLEDKQRELVLQSDRIKAQLDEMQSHAEVPSESELQQRREARDDVGAKFRSAISGEELGESETLDELQAQFFDLVTQCDQLSDRLRREAERVARRAKIEADAGLIQRQGERLALQLEELMQVESERRGQWFELWTHCQVEARSPKEMLHWLRNHQRLIEIAAGHTEASQREAALADRIAKASSVLHAAIAQHQSIDESDSLIELVGIGTALLDEVQRLVTQHSELVKENEHLQSSLPIAENALSKCQKELENWRGEWSGVVARLSAGEDMCPKSASGFIETYQDILTSQQQADDLQHRISGIEGDAELFATQVRGIRLPEASTEQSISEIVESWQQQVKKAQHDHTVRQQYRKRISESKEQLESLKQEYAESLLAIDLLCKEARCAVEGLHDADRRSREREKFADRLTDLNARIKQLAGSVSTDDFVADVREATSDALNDEIEDLSRMIGDVEQMRDEACKTLGQLDEQRKAMNGGALGAELQQDIHDLLGQIRHHAERYAQLRAAGTILSTAIQRYREENQAPVIALATEYFRRLTLGNFSGLRTDDNGKGTPVLLGVRADTGESIDVSAMSKGTADQLYLALRLASLKHGFASSEPIPLIVDDILIQCDLERARAAIELLLELSDTTQVIFFTHNQSLVDLIRETVDEGRFSVQELSKTDGDTVPEQIAVARSENATTKGKRRKAGTKKAAQAPKPKVQTNKKPLKTVTLASEIELEPVAVPSESLSPGEASSDDERSGFLF